MKAIKKALALCLALAMVVTAVPVSTADAAVKTAKLSKSSVTVAGNATKKQTKSVKVTTNADWKSVKVTASSADKKVATVKVSKKTVKVTAVKKGETKVTVKVTGKKSGKAVSKKLTLNVTVCGAGLAVKAPAELTVGDTAKLAVKTTPSTASCTFDVDKKEVATVSDNGTITAVAAGTAKVVVRTDYGKEKVVTVTVKEAAATSFTVDAKPVAANTVELAFSRDVAANATVTVQKAGLTTTVDGKATIEGKAGKFVASANFPTGKYDVIVKEGEVEAKGTFEITAQKVAKIEVTSTSALTDSTKQYAYVYYKCYDQYGADITAKTSVDVNTSAPDESLRRSEGKIILDAGAGKTFRYNDLVTVSIINTSYGIVCTKSLNVGMEQNVDAIEFAGFISVNDTAKIVDSLPVNFSRDTWIAIYRPLDQDGNYMSVSTTNFADNMTVTCDAPLLLDSTFKAPSAVAPLNTRANTYTIDGVDYEAFFVQPGMYTDKGGTAKLSVISNKTGKVTPVEIKVGAAAILESLVLSDPGTVCDSDKDVVIPFTAYTTDGNTTTDYEAIVRSTNELSLTASVGTIVISENADGSAVIKWTDDQTVRTYDKVDRPVILTTVVVGGKSSYMTMNVSDYALPQKVKSIVYDSVMVTKGVQKINFADDNQVKYVDQYGREMKASVADQHMLMANKDDASQYEYRFVIETKNTNVDIKAVDFGRNADGSYSYRGEYNGSYPDFLVTSLSAVDNRYTDWKLQYNGASLTDWKDHHSLPMVRYYATGDYDMSATTNTFKYYIEGKKKTAGVDKYAAQDDALTQNITVVSLKDVKGLYVDNIQKIRIVTAATAYDSGIQAVNASVLNVNGTLAVERKNDSHGQPTTEANMTSREVKVFGKYQGVKVSVPTDYLTNDTNGTFAYGGGYIYDVNADIDSSKLYDFKTATYARKFATGNVKIKVYSISGNSLSGVAETLTQKVEFSDEDVISSSIKFYLWGGETTATDMNATDLKFTINGSEPWDTIYRNQADYERWGKKNTYTVFDQYGDVVTNGVKAVTYSVKDVVESTSTLTHDVNGFGFSGNGSGSVNVDKAEITDKFNLVVTTEDGLEATLAVTMAGDRNAKISNVTLSNTDKKFRQDYLHYYKGNN